MGSNMRYKIEYSVTKTDCWGHILPSTLSVEYAETLTEAEGRAVEISAKLRKYDVNVLDLEGPAEDGNTTWCVSGYKAGRCIMTNVNYFERIGL